MLECARWPPGALGLSAGEGGSFFPGPSPPAWAHVSVPWCWRPLLASQALVTSLMAQTFSEPAPSSWFEEAGPALASSLFSAPLALSLIGGRRAWVPSLTLK